MYKRWMFKLIGLLYIIVGFKFNLHYTFINLTVILVGAFLLTPVAYRIWEWGDQKMFER